MKNWDDLIITLLVIIFTFGGGIKELLRRKRSTDRSRPYSPSQDLDSEGEEPEEPEPIRRSPVSTTPIGEPQTWQDILDMLRPREESPPETRNFPPATKTFSEPAPQSIKMVDDDEFQEPGYNLKKKLVANATAELANQPSTALFKRKSRTQFNIKKMKRNWSSAMVLSEILGPPKALRD